MDDIYAIVNEQKEYFNSQSTKDIGFRLDKLRLLKKNIKLMEKDIIEALKRDLNKPEFESYTTELGPVYSALDLSLKKTRKWAKPRKKPTPLYQWGKSYVEYEPYGCVLIIAPFNYPFLLAIEPLIGAIASGNTVVVKPSEMAKYTSNIVCKLLDMTFDREHVRAIEGEVETTTELLKQRFDYIFFTGSPRVAKIVMKAASDNLIPVTLELGGKSPTIIDESADIKVAARRIVWGKFLNTGQTCIAPDYILVDKRVKNEFIGELKTAIIDFYGQDIKGNKDFGRIINTKHTERLVEIIQKDKGQIIFGGDWDLEEKFISPTIIECSDTSSACMQDEIFGPILPIIGYSSLDEAIDMIRNFERPLAMYIFSKDKSNINKLKESILCGNITINDTIKHAANVNIPFGGVGNSGMGSYHGVYTFETFSHKRGVYENRLSFNVDTVFAPYNDKKLSLIRRIFG